MTNIESKDSQDENKPQRRIIMEATLHGATYDLKTIWYSDGTMEKIKIPKAVIVLPFRGD